MHRSRFKLTGKRVRLTRNFTANNALVDGQCPEKRLRRGQPPGKSSAATVISACSRSVRPEEKVAAPAEMEAELPSAHRETGSGSDGRSFGGSALHVRSRESPSPPEFL